MMKCTFIFSSVCLGGYYGPSCVEMCSNYCVVPRNCDRKTGACKGGCQRGWKTPTCKERKDLILCTEDYSLNNLLGMLIMVSYMFLDKANPYTEKCQDQFFLKYHLIELHLAI